MTLLHMESDEVRRAADQFYHFTTEIDENLGRLRRSLARLESAWRSPSADSFTNRFESALQRAGALSADGAALARRLSAEVVEWEQAAASLGGTGGSTGDGWGDMRSPFPIGFPPLYRYFPYPFPGIYRPGTGWIGGGWIGGGGFEGGFAGGGGGGGGGGAWGDDDMPDIDTEYTLIRGYQEELMVRYRAGEMTWDEMVGHLEEMEKSTHPDYFEGKVTLYERKAEGGGSVAWRENTITGEHGTFVASVGRATGEWDSSIRIGEDGLESEIGGKAGLYAIHGEGNAQLAGIDMAGQAYLGAEVEGEVKSRIDPAAGVFVAGAGVNAFAGMKAEGSANIEPVKGLNTGVKGGLMVGAGIVAEGEAGYEDGVFKIDYDLGAAWGIGAEIGFEAELDVIEAGQEIARIGSKVIYSPF